MESPKSPNTFMHVKFSLVNYFVLLHSVVAVSGTLSVTVVISHTAEDVMQHFHV